MNFCDWKILRELDEDFLATVKVAFVFGKDESSHKALMITKDDRVYCVGSNVGGYLGLGDTKPREVPTENVFLSKKGVKGFTCGNSFVVAYLHSGEIYCWGSFPHKKIESYRPLEIKFCSKVEVNTVECGSEHCIILTNDGKVFTWGNNDVGQLGHTNTYVFDGSIGTNSPCRVKGVLEKKKAIGISAGYNFSVVLLDDGRAVTWGDNQFGQLGTNQKESYSVVPVEVSSLESVFLTKVVCGCCHVLALSNEGILYTWGTYTDRSQSTDSILTYESPVKLDEDLRFTDIGALVSCGISAAKCKNGKVYMMGHTKKGIFPSLTETICSSVDQVFAYYSEHIMTPKPIRLENKSSEYNKLKVKRKKIAAEKNRKSGKVNFLTFCFNYALNHASEVISSPEFETWDRETMKTFIVEYVKKKENR